MALPTPFHLLPLDFIESLEFTNQFRPAGMRQPGERTMAFDAVYVRGFEWMYPMLEPDAVHDYVQLDKWAEALAERLGTVGCHREVSRTHGDGKRWSISQPTQPHPRAGIDRARGMARSVAAPQRRMRGPDASHLSVVLRCTDHQQAVVAQTHFSASLLYTRGIGFDRTPPPYKREVGGGGAAAFWWCGMVPRDIFYLIRDFWQPVQHQVVRIDGTLDHWDLADYGPGRRGWRRAGVWMRCAAAAGLARPADITRRPARRSPRMKAAGCHRTGPMPAAIAVQFCECPATPWDEDPHSEHMPILELWPVPIQNAASLLAKLKPEGSRWYLERSQLHPRVQRRLDIIRWC
eukprot:gene6045-13304_t